MKPTPEQYREAACALIGAGEPLEASSGPGEHVQPMTPANGISGAYVEVKVWVTAGQATPPVPEVQHVCGLSGFGQSLDDACPACRTRTERLVEMNR